MKTIKENYKKEIVAFHIGRGGMFNNQGHLTYIGLKRIGYFTEDLFCSFENEKQFKNRYGYDSTENGQKCILDLFSDRDFDELEEKFGITKDMLGEEVYYDCGGNSTGLTEADVKTGIGVINEDNNYDTTYTKYLEDCDEEELKLITDTYLFEEEEKYKKVNKEDYHVYQFINGYYGICKELNGGNCVFGGDSANTDDYNEEYINKIYEQWNGELTYTGDVYGWQIETN